MKKDSSCLYEFGPFRLDPVKRVLWRGAEAIVLTSRTFDTLLTLVQSAGETLDKDKLLETVWGDAVVEENNLTQCISSLRKTLGEGRKDHKYIVTIPGCGYRFVANVEKRERDTTGVAFGRRAGDASGGAPNPVVAAPPVSIPDPKFEIQNSSGAGTPEAGAAHADGAGGSAPRKPIENPKSKIQNYKALWLAAAVLALAAVVVFWLAENAPGHRAPQASRDAKAAPPGARTMLAVLPFDNLTGNPGQDYFSDGVTEEVITQLGRMDPVHLGVIARTSVMRYRHSVESIRRIAGELGVEYVVEGSVRRSGNQVRISTQLIRAADQTHLWAQSYQRPARDAFALQEEVARDCRAAIGDRLDPRATTRALPGTFNSTNPEAYEAYQKGVYFFNRRDANDLRKGVENFQQAIRRDPTYAVAYAGLANCYTLLGLDGMDPREAGTKAQAAALKAVELDGSLAESHTALAATMALYQWDWPAARQEFNAALRANPNYVLAHHWYAVLYLIPQKRFPEALAEMKMARQLDPLSLIVNTDLGWTYFIAGNYDDSLHQFKSALDLDPHFVPAHFRLAQYYLARKMYADAARETEEDLIDAGRPQAAARFEHAYQSGGYPRVISASIQKDLRDMRASHSGPALDLAQLYSLEGRSGEAVQMLSAVYRRRNPGLIYVGVDPLFASLRSDPHFQAIERRCGLNP